MNLQQTKEIDIKEKPNILVIADESKWSSLYCRIMQDFGYNLITAFDEWKGNPELWQDERVIGHNGPLCRGFVEALVEKVGANKYNAIVIDLLCEDLIAPLKHAGYKCPIVVIGQPPDIEKTGLLYIPILSDLKENLQKTLVDCLK